MKIKQKVNRKKIWLIVAIVVAVIIGLIAAYLVFAKKDPLTSLGELGGIVTGKDSSTKSEDESDQNEAKDSDKIVAPNTDHATPPATDESTGKQVIPVVTSVAVDGNMVYIRGGMNVVRDTGSCFASLTGPSGQKIRKDTALLSNASTTDCKTISVPTSELSSGKWTFTLNYLADDAEGQSSVASFTIQ